MNLFKKMYCRTFQFVFKCALPILPYRQPQILNSNDEVADLLRQLNKNRVLLVTDKGISSLGLTNGLIQTLNEQNIKVVCYDNTVANPTTDNVSEAVELYKNNNCEALIGFGGGSSIDCAKAVGARIARPKKSLAQMKGILKIRKRLPTLIAVPTTAGTGSETTLASVITDSETRHKYPINDFSLIPKYALLDAGLTVGLPKHITATTGMDALTHAIEAYIGNSTTRQTREYALRSIKAIFENLLVAYCDGENIKARENMLHASYDAGVAFTKSYVGYVHAIAHSLGGKYNIAHGLANAVILPYVLKEYGKKIYRKLWEIAVFTGLCDKTTCPEIASKLVIEKIEDMNKSMNIPTKIDGIKIEDIPYLAETAEKEGNPLYPVPVLFTAKQLEKIYYEVKNG